MQLTRPWAENGETLTSIHSVFEKVAQGLRNLLGELVDEEMAAG